MNPGSTPPDFGFGSDGGYYKLSQLRGLRKVLLAFCPDGVDASCGQGIRAVKQEWEEYRKRELITIVISAEKEDDLVKFAHEEPLPIILISDERRETMSDYGMREIKSPVLLLIGKDGVVQASWSRWPSNQEIFQAADRQVERGESGRAA